MIDINEAVYTSQSVLDGKPISWIYRSNQDGWLEFHSGCQEEESIIRIVSLDEILQLDRTIMSVVEAIDRGKCAYACPNGEWIIANFDEDEKLNFIHR